MSLTIASNIDSLQAQRQIALTTSRLSKTFQRLSSGLRINSASDDAAGNALADELRADTKLASVAVRNANDGLSITSIADTALEEINSILNRMLELAQQSSNGSYTTAQRSALSSEFVALGSEIERIARVTTFNTFNLLSGSSNITLQVGLDGTTNSQIVIGAVLGTLTSLGLATANSSALTYSIISTTTGFSQTAATTALSAIQGAIISLTSTRGTIAAAESRLSSAVNYLSIARENFIAAESRIRDADVAQEVAEMVRLQVLQQSATAVLAQANLQPQVVLRLLG
jgi:flagellin